MRVARVGALLCAVLAQRALAFDLLDAWRATLEHDAAYAAAAAEYRAGQEQGAQGLALLLPQLGLTSGQSRASQNQRSYADDPGRRLKNRTHSNGVNLTQPLFDVARYANYRQGLIKQDIAEIEFKNAQQQLMLDVASAYFAVLLAQDTLAATEAAKRAMWNRWQQAISEMELGSAMMTDVYEAQAGYDNARADEIQGQSELELARQTLARLSGLDALQIKPLNTRMLLQEPEPATLQGWLDLALDASLKIRGKQRAWALAQQGLLEKRAGHLPVLQFNAGYQETKNSEPDNRLPGPARARGTTLGLNLTLPLFSGGSTQSHVREAAARLDGARDQMEDARRQTREEVRRAWLGVSNGAALVRAQEQRLISARSKLEATRLGREVGVRGNLDLLRAEQDYSDVLKQRANARYRYLTAKLQLARAAGTLDETILRQANLALGPADASP